jgi:hypothetical protein
MHSENGGLFECQAGGTDLCQGDDRLSPPDWTLEDPFVISRAQDLPFQ